jgi:hypothetical protein
MLVRLHPAPPHGRLGKTLGIGTALVQRVVMEQPRPFGVDVDVRARLSLAPFLSP